MILSVTGHRPPSLVGGYRDCNRYLIPIAEVALSRIQPEKVLTGMALGWDQTIAYVCWCLNIPFVACIPCDDFGSNWPSESRIRYRLFLDRASEIVLVNEGEYEAWKMLKRDDYMVDNSDSVLALWSGIQHGGTFHTVQYALAHGKTVDNCWEAYADRWNLKGE